MTSTQLSEKLAALGRSTSAGTIRKHWAAGAPRHSTAAFIRWLSKNTGSRNDPRLADLRREKLLAEIELLEQRRISEERDNREQALRYVEATTVRADRAHAAEVVVRTLEAAFVLRLPEQVGERPAAEIAAAYKKALHEIRVILSTPGVYDR
jgi:hypothetical protein